MTETPLYVNDPLPVCSCCRRTVKKVSGSIWHGDHKICDECFYVWYDPDVSGVDQTDSLSIGNAIRRKLGLEELKEN